MEDEMKNCSLSFILCLSFIFLNVRAQEQYPREVKIYSPNNSGNPGTVFPPTIITSPIPFSSTDYYIYPSMFSQSEMTIALSLLNPNNLLVGANVVNPAGTDFWQGYYIPLIVG